MSSIANCFRNQLNHSVCVYIAQYLHLVTISESIRYSLGTEGDFGKLLAVAMKSPHTNYFSPQMVRESLVDGKS